MRLRGLEKCVWCWSESSPAKLKKLLNALSKPRKMHFEALETKVKHLQQDFRV